MNIHALCAVSTGVDTLRLIAGQIPIASVIGLTEREATPAISGYTDMRFVSEALGLPFTPVESYGLTDARDVARLKALKIDVLIVCGWQRLVPTWLVEHVSIGCIGAHGSPGGISAGRGRSPQNWALIAGADNFEVSIFFIEPGVDSGPVIATRAFPLSVHDDIVSSYLKVNLNVADMLVEAFRTGAIAARRAEPQGSCAQYLPQRTPEDGAIDWRRSAESISRFIAALTRPYPGAFAMMTGTHVTVWRARSFDMPHTPAQPGRVVYRALSGPLIIQTGSGLLLVDDYDAAGTMIETGALLESFDFKKQMQTIIDRHDTRYPSQPLSDLVRGLVG